MAIFSRRDFLGFCSIRTDLGKAREGTPSNGQRSPDTGLAASAYGTRIAWAAKKQGAQGGLETSAPPFPFPRNPPRGRELVTTTIQRALQHLLKPIHLERLP